MATAGSDFESQQAVAPFLEGKIPRGDLPTAYVCERYVCQLPTTDLDVFSRQLDGESASH